MTWRELRDTINTMTPAQIDQDIFALERYGDGEVIGPLRAIQCAEDYLSGFDGSVAVAEGNYMLFVA